MKRSLGLLGRVLLLAPLAGMVAMAGPICGPGTNWVAGCAGGTYDTEALFENGLVLGSNTYSLIQFLGTSDITVSAGGTTASVVIAATEIDGLGFGATLTGTGAVGSITQNPDNVTASSFFDIFFDITIPTVGVLYNKAPLVVSNSTLTGLPLANGTTFTESPLPLNLYEFAIGGSASAGDPLVGQLLAPPGTLPDKQVVPEPGTWTMMAGGLAVAAGLMRRRVR